jgi:type IX secretion system PorP/SprF family membrane protein
MRYFIIVLLSIVSLTVSAQDEILDFTDYDVTKPFYNPAAMGLEPGLEGIMMYRTRFEAGDMWPSMGALNVNKLFEEKNMGGGITMFFDKQGPYRRFYAYLAGVYRLQINEGKYLFFGLQAGINYVTNRGGYVTADEETIYSENYSQPNFGFGLHYKSEKMFLGLSIPEFKYNTIDENGNKITNMMSDKLRVYMYGGIYHKVSEHTTLMPMVNIFYSEQEDVRLSLGAKIDFKKNLEFGAQYRTKEGYALTARVRLFDELWLGYSFEGNNSDIQDRFNSNQEITLTVRLNGKKAVETPTEGYEDINSIRYF